MDTKEVTTAAAPGARLDEQSWEQGRRDGLARKRQPSQPVACGWSWSSGAIEGEAERQRQQQRKREQRGLT